MRQLVLTLLKQGYLIEQNAIDILSNEALSGIDLSKIILSANPPKFITKKFILDNLQMILNNFKEDSLNETARAYLSSFLEVKQITEEQKEKIKTNEMLEEFKKRKIQILESPEIKNKKIGVEDFVEYFRSRYNSLKKILQERNLESLSSIGKLSTQRKNLSLIGMIYNKRYTKNKNLLLEIEDLTGKITVLVNCNKKELFEKAKDTVLDEVIAITGIGSSEIFFANEIFFPEIGLSERKKSPEDEYAVFTGDFHTGSKLFLEENFNRFKSWINGEIGSSEQKEIAKKVKYLFIVGDLVEGVGIYPSQEKDLAIKDIYNQYKKFTDLIGGIRKDITIVICPGNHDAVRLVEPQPVIEKSFIPELKEMSNVFLTTNPSIVNIGKTESFSGFNVLLYHGFSFCHYMDDVDSLRMANAKMKPDLVMHFLLKRRHLAPTHTSTTYLPHGKDFLLIENAPDIFLSGHTHHIAVSHYNNILTLSCSSWIPKTTYQEKLGIEPDPCKVPIMHLKTGKVNILDFS